MSGNNSKKHSAVSPCSHKQSHRLTGSTALLHRLFFLLSRQEVVSRAIDAIFRFSYFVSGPPLKLVKKLPHNCDLSSVFIRGNRLICVFKSFVPKNDALGDHVILFEPKHRVNCTRHDFLTRQEKKEPVAMCFTFSSQPLGVTVLLAQ